MTFNRKIWLNWKVRKPCPTCGIGILDVPGSNGIIKSETEKSKEMNTYGGYYDSEYVFSIHLKCNNCSETVAVSGFMAEENYPSDEELGIQRRIVPISFFPAPKIIEIPNSCPANVKKILSETFGLYWLDLGSCANKIRISIEVLLNELSVISKKATKKGDTDLSLHSRLEIFEKTNPDVAKHLMAIKWIGNAGSHFSELSSEDVLDAYELLEFSLEKLYNDRELKLKQISDEINKSRKPRK